MSILKLLEGNFYYLFIYLGRRKTHMIDESPITCQSPNSTPAYFHAMPLEISFSVIHGVLPGAWVVRVQCLMKIISNRSSVLFFKDPLHSSGSSRHAIGYFIFTQAASPGFGWVSEIQCYPQVCCRTTVRGPTLCFAISDNFSTPPESSTVGKPMGLFQ